MARGAAESLVGDMPGALLEARRLAALAPGAHGRRRAGAGDGFWQYRAPAPEDGARLVDWRRSARGERLFVREREREAAQTLSLWIDPGAGFAWRGGDDRPSKAQRAHVLALAIARAFARGGERVGVMGRVLRHGPRAADALAHDLAAPCATEPSAPPPRSAVLIVSDFYEGEDVWRRRLAAASSVGAHGALLMIADPAEEDFPFEGRTLFRDPGGAGASVTLGRAEHARAEYAARLAAYRARLRALAGAHGLAFLAHRTDHAPAPAFSALLAALSERRR
ncbi:MAG: DUF58 domain-containing protein [Hyphomonadaceae bacterium]|nr:DUF58 domain-containing protein [Hyphomonadaceae bacterium]